MGEAILRTDLLPRLPLDSFLARYGNGRRREKMAPLYSEMHAVAEQLAAPAVLYAEFPCGALPELAAWLTPVTQAVVLGVCTLGPALERRISELSDDKTAWAAVLDEISTAQIVALVQSLHTLVRGQAARRGLKGGPAFRPGLGRWPLAAQRVLFDRLPAHRIQVTLSDHMLMTPAKSTSIVVPLRPAHTSARG